MATTSKTRLSVAVRFFRRVAQSAPQALSGDRDDPVDNDALGRAPECPRSAARAPRPTRGREGRYDRAQTECTTETPMAPAIVASTVLLPTSVLIGVVRRVVLMSVIDVIGKSHVNAGKAK